MGQDIDPGEPSDRTADGLSKPLENMEATIKNTLFSRVIETDRCMGGIEGSIDRCECW